MSTYTYLCLGNLALSYSFSLQEALALLSAFLAKSLAVAKASLLIQPEST